MLGKLKSMVTGLSRRSDNIYPVKAAMVQFTGNGAANPTTVHSYGCTVVRNAAGVYRVTMASNKYLGSTIVVKSCIALHWSIAPIAATSLFAAEARAVAPTLFDIRVYSITQGAGTDLVRTAYDIVVGDVIDFSVLLNAGTGLLPNG